VTAKAVSWTFLSLPKDASAKLSSRGKVDRRMREEAGAETGLRTPGAVAPPGPRLCAETGAGADSPRKEVHSHAFKARTA